MLRASASLAPLHSRSSPLPCRWRVPLRTTPRCVLQNWLTGCVPLCLCLIILFSVFLTTFASVTHAGLTLLALLAGLTMSSIVSLLRCEHGVRFAAIDPFCTITFSGPPPLSLSLTWLHHLSWPPYIICDHFYSNFPSQLAKP